MVEISREDIDQLNAVLKINVTKDDYTPKIDTTIKEYCRKADLKGFRKGHVPPNVIRNMYGNQILADELNKIIGDELEKYLKESKIDILGQPLPKEDKQIKLDISKSDDYLFTYELGLSPTIELKTISPKTKFNRYEIEVDNTTIDEEVENLRMKHGEMLNPNDVQEKDVLYLNFKEIKEKADGTSPAIDNDSAFPVDMIKDASLKKKILKAKKNDSFEVDIFKAFDKEKDEIKKQLLGMEDTTQEVGHTFSITIKNINRMVPATINQDFFDKIYGKGMVKSEAECRDRLKNELSGYLREQSERKLDADIISKLTKDTNVKLPDDFLKRWIAVSNEKPVSADQIEDEYEKFANNLKWSLIINSLAKEQNIEVKPEDVESRTRESITEQLKHFGNEQVGQDQIEMYIKQMLENKEHVRKTYDKLFNERIFGFLKSTFTIKEKKVSLKEFEKLIKS